LAITTNNINNMNITTNNINSTSVRQLTKSSCFRRGGNHLWERKRERLWEREEL